MKALARHLWYVLAVLAAPLVPFLSEDATQTLLRKAGCA